MRERKKTPMKRDRQVDRDRREIKNERRQSTEIDEKLRKTDRERGIMIAVWIARRRDGQKKSDRDRIEEKTQMDNKRERERQNGRNIERLIDRKDKQADRQRQRATVRMRGVRDRQKLERQMG